MKPILTRTFSGAIYIILTLGSVILGPVAFGFASFIFLILCLVEYYKMFSGTGIPMEKFSFLSAGIASYIIVILFLWDIWSIKYLLMIIPLIFVVFIGELFRVSKNPLSAISFNLLGLLYIVLPFSLLNFLFFPELNSSLPSNSLLIGFFILIWTNDTFAYLSGMMFGRYKFFERLSPKKTWEGTIGGALSGIVMSLVLSLFYPELTISEWIGYALTIIIFGTFGDLFESMMKRTLGLKDSGNIMPGHGGILDRFDSILMAAPFAFIYIVFVLN